MKHKDLSELSLKKVKINGNVLGKFGTFEVEQTYTNNSKDILEVSYTFPIVETATVVGFEIKVGDKVLKGKCKEAQKAKKEYITNIIKGNSSYMMEQETENIFRISVGKINRNEEVKIKILYIDNFEIIDNNIKILMPTLVVPRYNSAITSTLKYGKVDYTVDFNIKIDNNLNVKSINSPSHKMTVVEEDDAKRVVVENYDLSKDFKLNLELKNELTSNAIKSKTKEGQDVLYLSFMPEIQEKYNSGKEFVFIVDISGSMSGENIKETKKAVIECLKQLKQGDRFNIIAFETYFEAMSITSIEYNEENLERAIKYVNALETDGGTEILKPLKYALYEKDVEKIILLFTDGQIGNETEILNYVKSNINRSRIFPFGIDQNVNAFFIRELAKAGQGKAELIQPNEKIDDKIIRTFKRIQTPILENLEIDYGTNKVIDEIKQDKSLFNYEYFNVFAKLENLQDDIILRGKILENKYEWKISKDDIKKSDVDLEVLFAKVQIDRLEEYIRNNYDDETCDQYKKMIIDLSEKYNINSKYTSFVTVYERKNKIFDVPIYEETTLSEKFMEKKSSIFGRLIDSVSFEDGTLYDMEENTIFDKKKSKQPSFNTNTISDEDFSFDTNQELNTDTDTEDSLLPPFLRRFYGEEKDDGVDKELLEQKLNDYYTEFMAQEKKELLTYLLYTLYYLKTKRATFNYEEALSYLKTRKQEISEKNIYKQLLYLCFKELREGNFFEKMETYSLLGDEYKKAIISNAKIYAEIDQASKDEIQEIIKNDKIKENIDKCIWYLYKHTFI